MVREIATSAAPMKGVTASQALPCNFQRLGSFNRLNDGEGYSMTTLIEQVQFPGKVEGQESKSCK